MNGKTSTDRSLAGFLIMWMVIAAAFKALGAELVPAILVSVVLTGMIYGHG